MIGKITLLTLLLCTIQGLAQNPVFKSITPNATTIDMYAKFEADIEVMATYTNPYDYDEIAIQAFITKPSGKKDTIDAFYCEVHNIITATGGTQNTGQKIFKLRYTPDEAGNYEYHARVTDKIGQNSSSPMHFFVNDNQNEKGFVRQTTHRYLQYDNDETYIAIGENMCWQNTNAYKDYTLWLDNLSDNGGNFIRQWHCPWGIGVEWSTGIGYSGLKKYNQIAGTYQDWLLDYCDEKDIKIMLALNYHGQVSTQVNPNWNDNPYNAAKGGPCTNTWDFFTNTTAKSLLKNRLRYIIARWGYSKSILVWELFNEVEWTDNFHTHKESIIDWHIEMANYIKQKDVYNHLVSTSLANDSDVDRMWNDASMDITQTHFYNDLKLIHDPVAANVVDFNSRFNKPNLVGEFGLGGSASLSNVDPEGIHIHNTLWSTLFSGALGTGMSWWWDNYIHPQNLYHHFKGPSVIVESEDLTTLKVNNDFTLSGSKGDLELSPSLGWGQKGDTEIEIKEGTFIPATPKVSSFLYGSQWNTQFRSPPVFKVSYDQAGTFSVRTGNELSTNPKIKITLNGSVVLEQNAEKNKTYSIPVPFGQHLISVDNSGTDWISISAYSFSGQGQKLDVYHMKHDNHNQGMAWIINKSYNHIDKPAGNHAVVSDAQLIVHSVPNGNYTLTWYSTVNGDIINETSVTVANNQLQVVIPSLDWDMVLKYKSESISATHESSMTSVSLYPNPVGRGQMIHFNSLPHKNDSFVVLLFTLTGELVFNHICANNKGFVLPSHILPGHYILQIHQGKIASTSKLEIE